MKSCFVSVGNNIIETFVAASEVEQARGLMFIEPPVPNMIFTYASPRINKFWMQNTPAPLDIIFCYENKMTQICQGKPFSTDMIGNNEYSDMVLEMPYGSVQKLGISVGTSIRLL